MILAREYGWTYEEIGRMVLDDFFDAISSVIEYRKKVFPIDISLNSICIFLGIKKPHIPASIDSIKALKWFPAFKFTEAEYQKWYKAGMPNPTKYFKRIN